MIWQVSHRADARAKELADRHYNRQKPDSKQFVPPGRCFVLYAHTISGKAFWVTSWPFAEYVRHAWAGAWMCSAFRNEGAGVASEMIRDAVAATRHHYGDPPEIGMVTFLDRKHVKPTKVRGKDVWGWTWQKAGFQMVGVTKSSKLLAFRLPPADMPPPREAPDMKKLLG